MTEDKAAEVESSPALDRQRQLMAVLSVVVLIAGVAVLLLGRAAESDASDDLRVARQRLHEQQSQTRSASRCTADVERHRHALADNAHAVLSNAEQLLKQDETIESVIREVQAAGVVRDLARYNNAIDRGNQAGDAANLLRPQGLRLSAAFDETVTSLIGPCDSER